MDIVAFISYALGIIVIVAIAFVVVRSSTNKETNRINKENIEALKTQNGIQASQIEAGDKARKELEKTVTSLSGKVDTLSTIPLAKIETHMANTNQILQAILPLIPTSTIQHTILETTTTNK